MAVIASYPTRNPARRARKAFSTQIAFPRDHIENLAVMPGLLVHHRYNGSSCLHLWLEDPSDRDRRCFELDEADDFGFSADIADVGLGYSLAGVCAMTCVIPSFSMEARQASCNSRSFFNSLEAGVWAKKPLPSLSSSSSTTFSSSVLTSLRISQLTRTRKNFPNFVSSSSAVSARSLNLTARLSGIKFRMPKSRMTCRAPRP